jgi:hypothetical protein
VDGVNLREALDFQSPAVRAAALAAHEQLDRLGIRHAFAGGLAVGAHGYVRATGDVHLLVAMDAFEQHAGGLVTFRPGVPIQIAGISVDYLTVGELGPHVAAALDAPVSSDGLPVVSLEVLVNMKLVAHRMRDRADVVELLERGADVERARTYLAAHAPDLVQRFDDLARHASEE